jgi:hypothetical protein
VASGKRRLKSRNSKIEPVKQKFGLVRGILGRDDSEERAMSYWGRVSKGTVMLPPDANLPDGTEVRVEPVAPKTLAERFKDIIGIVQGGPRDLAENHDPYIHGTPQSRIQKLEGRS